MPILKGKQTATATTAPQRQFTKAKPNPQSQAGQHQKQEAEKSATDAFAERYAKTEASKGGTYVPPEPGTYNALITEGQGVVKDLATSAYFEFTICGDVNGDDALQGKTCRMYFNFTDEEGREASGMGWFRGVMEQLGYPDAFTSWTEMCEALASLASEEVWVVIDVKKKGKWTNIYLNNVPEDQTEKPSYQ